jgi:C1A family cysteine protease
VKKQGKRGTCSIFTTVALVESHLKRKSLLNGMNSNNYEEFNYSEEWLEYLAMRNKTEYFKS